MNERERAENLQKQPLEQNEDWQRLKQQRAYLERKLQERRALEEQLRELYSRLDTCEGPEELREQLQQCRELLRQVFTSQGQVKRSPLQSRLLELDWERYGIDVSEYVASSDSLLGKCANTSLD